MSENTLVKTHYLKELAAPDLPLKFGDEGAGVKRVKEWLMLWQFDEYFADIALILDENFDKNCELLVKEIQKFSGLYKSEIKPTGIVDEKTWQFLTLPLAEAMDLTTYKNLKTPAERQVYFASRHLQFHASELLQDNLGPWVRSYVDGNDGDWAAWCQAFACMIWDQTFSSYGKRFDKVYANTWSCEKALEQAKASGHLRSHEEVVSGRYQPKPGDLALYTFTGSSVAHHTEVVYEILDASTGQMRTIGGNTNFAGSNTGVGVFFVNRNYLSSPRYIINFISMISLEEMINV